MDLAKLAGLELKSFITYRQEQKSILLADLQ